MLKVNKAGAFCQGSNMEDYSHSLKELAISFIKDWQPLNSHTDEGKHIWYSLSLRMDSKIPDEI